MVHLRFSEGNSNICAVVSGPDTIHQALPCINARSHATFTANALSPGPLVGHKPSFGVLGHSLNLQNGVTCPWNVLWAAQNRLPGVRNESACVKKRVTGATKNKNTCFTYRLVSPQPPQPDWVCFADLKRAESTIKHNEAHKQHMCSKLRQGPNQYIASFAKSWSAGFVGSLKHRMKLLTAWQVSSHSAANMIVIIITITIIIIIIIIIVIFVKSTLFFLHLAASISKTQLEVVASIIGNVHDLVILKVLAAMGKVRLYSMDWLREKS